MTDEEGTTCTAATTRPEQLEELIARFDEAAARSEQAHAVDEGRDAPALARLTEQLTESAATLKAGAELARAVVGHTRPAQ